MENEIQEVTPEQRSRYQRILRWDLSREKEYCAARLGYTRPEVLQEMELAYKRYIFLVCEYHSESLPASEKFDDLWHAHILNVRQYVAFCNDVFGRLIYHHPTVSDDENRALQPAYEKKTLKYYEKHFGKPNTLWRPAQADNACCTH